MGLVFALLAILGLFFAPGGLILGFIPSNTGLALVYLITTVVLLYGYFTSDRLAHMVAAIIGLVFAALAIIGLFTGSFLGLPTGGWNIVVNLIAAVVLIYNWLGTPRKAV
jgi:K+ transporter